MNSKAECGRRGGQATLDKYGLDFYTHVGRRGGRPKSLSIDQLRYEEVLIRQMYCNELKTTKEIAELLYVSPDTIRNRMRRFGISFRQVDKQPLTSKPYDGELRRGYQIGRARDKGLYKWCACLDCGKCRWVAVLKHNNLMPVNERCPSCANKINGSNHRGDKNHSWKGGEYRHQGYVMVLSPKHPRARKDGHVKRAILVLEKHLRRFIPREMDVHHINGVKDDDRPENLIELSHKEHAAYHQEQLLRQQQPFEAQINIEGGLDTPSHKPKNSLKELRRLCSSHWSNDNKNTRGQGTSTTSLPARKE